MKRFVSVLGLVLTGVQVLGLLLFLTYRAGYSNGSAFGKIAIADASACYERENAETARQKSGKLFSDAEINASK